MISVYYLTNVVPAALFGIFALWAAGSQCHWFLRTAVVGAALLVMLLIPAYELVIEFGTGILLVVLGFAIWRRWRRRRATASSKIDDSRAGLRPRMSLSTLLLLVVVVAVSTAVVAQAPTIPIYQWYECLGIGILTAAAGLTSAWLVYGQTRWWLRLAAMPPLVVWLAVATRWFWFSRWLLQHWITTPSFVPTYLQARRNDGLFSGSAYWMETISIGMAILCSWLLLMRSAAWFDPFREMDEQSLRPQHSTRWRTAARWAVSALFVLVSLFPLLLLYWLLTPTPIPDLSAPRPNGYDDLLAAGRMFGERDADSIFQLGPLSDVQIREAVSRSVDALAVAHKALQRDCRFPLSGRVEQKPCMTADERRALYGLRDAYCIRTQLPSKNFSAGERLEANLDLLRLAILEARSSGVDRYDQYGFFMTWEWSATEQLWLCRNEMSAEQCLELTHALLELDDQRVAWDRRVELEQIIAENSGWKKHLRVILDERAGADPNEREHDTDRKKHTRLRVLILGLAIQAFSLNTGSPPTPLAELVPDYLPAIPADPYDEGQPLKYRAAGDRNVIYSVGPNGVDDGGTSSPNGTSTLRDDLTDVNLFPAPASQPAADVTDDRN